MDVIGKHAASLPALDHRWEPRPFPRDELARALVDGGVAGMEVSHPLDNVLRNIGLLLDGDPDKGFGLSGLEGLEPADVLELVGRAAGFRPDPSARTGPVPVDPHLVLDACEAVGDRLAEAVRRRERVLIGTGHPVGLAHLYVEVGRLLRRGGIEILEPADGVRWRDPERDHDWELRYLDGVALISNGRRPHHTHRPDAMARMLELARPDLVLGDHGFAGAAIERGVETISIADVNDPALLVARAQGRTEIVIVMDDNVEPQAYWPCFQAIAARLPLG